MSTQPPLLYGALLIMYLNYHHILTTAIYILSYVIIIGTLV